MEPTNSIGTEPRPIMTEPDEAELSVLGLELVASLNKLDTTQARKKLVTGEFNDQIKTISQEVAGLRLAIDTKRVEVTVNYELIPDWNSQTVAVTHPVTGEILETRPMTDAERELRDSQFATEPEPEDQ